MRICPKCNRQFPDNTLFCPDDGRSLVHRVEESVAAHSSANFDAAQTLNHRSSTSQNRGPAYHSSSGPTLLDMPSQPVTGPHRSPITTPPEEPFDPNNLVNQSLFGEYTITKKLGEGGMGAVYLAKQNSIDQKIAVKVLHEHAASSDELVQRFHREAHVVSLLTHPNIIRVFIFGRTRRGLLYLAMEFVDGDSLRERLDQGMLDELTAIKIMKQLCSGLSEAHDLGIIHRDLKPDNVLLTEFRGETNFVKILDFGIAKLKQPDGQEDASQKLTQAGIVYGTPEYLSPEQAQAHELDQRTDIYSLGVMLYELMTGQVPFQASVPVQILTAHVFTDPTPPSQVAPHRVSPTMEKIILKAMAKDREERYQTAMEFFEALVAREQEIVREQGLDGRAAYVPGMELTGMYHALNPGDLLGADSAPQNANQRASNKASKTTNLPQVAPNSPDLTSQNSMRTLIYVLIGLASLALLGMIGTIIILIAK